MTKAVIVCSPEDNVTDVTKLMSGAFAICPSRTAINSWGSLASAMFSSTALASCKWKQGYFGIMRWPLDASC